MFVTDGDKRIATIDTLTVDNKVAVGTLADIIRYQYDNHLGSASLELDETAATISYEEYHPFGTSSYRLHTNSTEVSRKRYRYVGKERDEETGLYYYGARYYASWIARFISTDPMAGERSWVNPYNYCQNNPINRTDPTGALDDDHFDRQGNYLYTDDKTTKNIIIHTSNKESLMSDVDLSMEALRKIGQHYISEIGDVSNDVNIWGREGGSSTMRVETYGGPNENNYLGMFITKKSSLAIDAGKTSKLLDNSNDLKSTIAHEWWHYSKQYTKDGSLWFKTPPRDMTIRELDAYDFQISHDTWKNTSTKFQKHIISNIGSYLNKIDNDKLKSSKIQHFENKLKIKYTNFSNSPKKVNWKLNIQ